MESRTYSTTIIENMETRRWSLEVRQNGALIATLNGSELNEYLVDLHTEQERLERRHDWVDDAEWDATMDGVIARHVARYQSVSMAEVAA